MDLLDELATRVLVGDGAIGTLLLDQGVPLKSCFEELCVSQPDRIGTIHSEYIEAGARVIKTNTFGANAVRLARFGLEGCVREINSAAARIAQEAASGKEVIVAGSVGPLGIDAEEAARRGIDRTQCFREQMEALFDAGVELIFLETFADLPEIEIALRAKNDLGTAPAICSFAPSARGRLASGVLLAHAGDRLRATEGVIFGVNCVSGPEILPVVGREWGLIAAYPNAGSPVYRDGRFVYPATPDFLGEIALALAAKGTRLIGGCCGTNPSHIKAVAEALSNERRG